MTRDLVPAVIAALVVGLSSFGVVYATFPEEPGGGRGQVEIAEVLNNRTEPVEVSVRTVQYVASQGDERRVVVDAFETTLEPGGSTGPELLDCSRGFREADSLVAVANPGDENRRSPVPLEPEHCQPGGGSSFRVLALSGAIVVA